MVHKIAVKNLVHLAIAEPLKTSGRADPLSDRPPIPTTARFVKNDNPGTIGGALEVRTVSAIYITGVKFFRAQINPPKNSLDACSRASCSV